MLTRKGWTCRASKDHAPAQCCQQHWKAAAAPEPENFTFAKHFEIWFRPDLTSHDLVPPLGKCPADQVLLLLEVGGRPVVGEALVRMG